LIKIDSGILNQELQAIKATQNSWIMNSPPSICPELASARGLKIKGMIRPKKQNKLDPGIHGLKRPSQDNEQ
jgi:hypothetical protein